MYRDENSELAVRFAWADTEPLPEHGAITLRLYHWMVESAEHAEPRPGLLHMVPRTHLVEPIAQLQEVLQELDSTPPASTPSGRQGLN